MKHVVRMIETLTYYHLASYCIYVYCGGSLHQWQSVIARQAECRKRLVHSTD